MVLIKIGMASKNFTHDLIIEPPCVRHCVSVMILCQSRYIENILYVYHNTFVGDNRMFIFIQSRDEPGML